jgi:hypothetical protein
MPANAARCPTCGHVAGEPVVVERGAVGSGPRGRRTTLVALAVVLAVIGVLVVVDLRTRPDDDAAAAADATTTTERATPTTRRSSSTTTTTTRTFEPTIALAPGLRLLAWPWGAGGELFDPATGTISGAAVGTGEHAWVVPRLGGVVVVSFESSVTVRWHAELRSGDAPTTRLLSEGRDVSSIFPSEIASRVWMAQYIEPMTLLSEVDVTTGEEFGVTTLPAGAYPVGSIDGGLVIQGVDGLYFLRRGADRFERIVSGEYIDSSGGWLAYRACDEFLRCPISVRDLDSGTDVEMDGSSGVETGGIGAFFSVARLSPDGRWLAVASGSELRQTIVVFDVATGRAVPVADVPSTMEVQVAWTPDSEWLLWPQSPGIGGFRPDDGTTVVLDAGNRSYRGVAVLGAPAPG